MFSLFASGRRSHNHVVSPTPEGPIRVDEARFAAWALALGEVRPPTDPPPPRKPHRGMLPDVDWSNALPLPRRRSLLRLIAGAIAARLVPLVSLGQPSIPHAVGDDGDRREAAQPQPAARPRIGHAATRLAA